MNRNKLEDILTSSILMEYFKYLVFLNIYDFLDNWVKNLNGGTVHYLPIDVERIQDWIENQKEDVEMSCEILRYELLNELERLLNDN